MTFFFKGYHFLVYFSNLSMFVHLHFALTAGITESLEPGLRFLSICNWMQSTFGSKVLVT